jgi:zinc transporter ZupT
MKAFLNVLLAFAAGALVGDAILHMIPHAYIEVLE